MNNQALNFDNFDFFSNFNIYQNSKCKKESVFEKENFDFQIDMLKSEDINEKLSLENSPSKEENVALLMVQNMNEITKETLIEAFEGQKKIKSKRLIIGIKRI